MKEQTDGQTVSPRCSADPEGKSSPCVRDSHADHGTTF